MEKLISILTTPVIGIIAFFVGKTYTWYKENPKIEFEILIRGKASLPPNGDLRTYKIKILIKVKNYSKYKAIDFKINEIKFSDELRISEKNGFKEEMININEYSELNNYNFICDFTLNRIGNETTSALDRYFPEKKDKQIEIEYSYRNESSKFFYKKKKVNKGKVSSKQEFEWYI